MANKILFNLLLISSQLHSSQLYGPKFTLYGFLRYKCNQFCDTYRLDGEVKIEKFSNENTKHIEQMTKSKNNSKRGNTGNRKPAPKLNYPINHLKVKSSHLNPQGFSKVKPLPNHGDPFYEVKSSANKIEEEFLPPEQKKITLANFLDDQPNEEFNDALSIPTFLNLDNEKSSHLKSTPQVRNSFEFPCLSREQMNSGTNQQQNNFGFCSYSSLIPKLKIGNIAAQLEKHAARIQSLKIAPPPCDSSSDDDEEEIPKLQQNEESEEDENDFERESVENKTPGSAASSGFYKLDNEVMKLEDFNQEMPKQFKSAEEDEKPPLEMDFKDPLFLIDYPEVVMDSSQKIVKARVKKLEKKLQFPIYITTTYSPSQFYFQCDDEKLKELMGMLQTFYDSIPEFGLQIGTTNLQVGQIVGAKMDGIWYRAEVLSLNSEGKVEVLFVDFGIILNRPIFLIRYLPVSFLTTPVKAYRGCLFGIEADGGSDQWSDSARNFFFLKIKDKLLHASIRSSDDESYFYLDIVDDLLSGKNIADQMIESYYGKKKKAILDDDSFPYAELLPL